jgi:hypothetical protein
VITIAADALPSLTQLLSNTWGWYGETSASSKSVLSVEAVKKTEQIKALVQGDAGLKFGIGGFYQIDPDGLPLSVPSLIEITYEDSEIDGFQEEELSVYRWNKNTGKWEFLGGTVDTVNNKVTATINKLGTFTLAPKIPYNSFDLIPADTSIPADGSSTTTITSETILYNDNSVVADGTLITIEAEKGTLLATDADSEIEGLQLATGDGIISFEIKSGYVASEVNIYASSLGGEAQGSCVVTFTDRSIPHAPKITAITPGNEKIIVKWEGPSDPDIAGYILYYDVDSGEPYEGEATIYGLPSPINVGPMNIWEITGLSNGQTYYITVTAYDVARNESVYSNVVNSTPVSDSDEDGLYDDLEKTTCTGFNDADTDDDGISDGVEDANHNGVLDPGETDPCQEDTDGDGIQDGTELGITEPVSDPDWDGPLLGTDTSIFIPDADPNTTTNPLNADSDGDGAWDGTEDANCNGRVDAGETDPSDASSKPAALIHLKKGFNLVAIPSDVTSIPELKDWLPVLGDASEIEKVMAYDDEADKFITVTPEDPSNPSFILKGGEGLIVYAKQDKEITFTSVLCSTLDLNPGFNLVGFACPEDGYSAHQLLNDLGSENISSIQRYSTEKGAFETAGFDLDGQLVGVDFTIIAGKGYFIYRK